MHVICVPQKGAKVKVPTAECWVSAEVEKASSPGPMHVNRPAAVFRLVLKSTAEMMTAEEPVKDGGTS